MTTIINTPAPAESNGNSGLIIGLFVLIILGLMFYYFGIPAIRQMGQASIPQINVPNKIDVNIKQTP